MKKVVATGKTSLSNNTEMHVGPTPPLYPVEGQLWLNTSVSPPQLYKWDGEKWVLQEIDVEKLDPEFVEKTNEKIDENHQEVLDEIAQINSDAQAMKDAVLEQNAANDAYFKEVNAEIDRVAENLQVANDDIIANRGEYLGLYGDINGKHSVLAQTVDGIATRVKDAEGNISKVTQTASSLGTRLTNAEGSISTVTQTASTLSSKLSTVEGSVSQLTQTASGLQSTVKSITDGTASVITQMKNSINLKVSAGELVSQINASKEGLYLAGKLIYLDGTVKVDDTFYAKRIISANSNETEYTKIEGRKLTSYGYYSAYWTEGYVSGYHSLTANLGYIAMKQETGSWSNNSQPTLYYTARGISTMFGANDSASGTIEFFASGYSASVNSLRVKSSGNIILESTASGGSNIFLNPKGGNVIISDYNYNNYYNLYAGRIFANGGANITSDKNTLFYFGNFYTNDTNINSRSEAIKIGGGTGNIVCTKVTETSAREKKKNITPFEKNATAIINSSYIRNYQYLDDVDDLDLPYVGLILDEAPLEVVDTFGNGVLPSNATFVAWKAIQELSARIEQLEGKVA